VGILTHIPRATGAVPILINRRTGSAGCVRRSRPPHLFAAWVFVLGILAVDIVFFINPGDVALLTQLTFRYLALSGVVVLVVLAGLKWGSISQKYERFDIIELPVWYSLWTLLGIMPFGVLAFFDQRTYLLDSPGFRVEWVPDGLPLIAIGLAGMWLGYRLGWFSLRWSAKTASTSKRVPSLKAIILLYVLIWVSRIWRFTIVGAAFGAQIERLGSLSVFAQWFAIFDKSALLLIAIVALQVFRGAWSMGYLWFFAGCEFVYGGLTGFMKPTLWLVILIFGMAQYSTGRVKRRRMIGIFALGTVLLFFIIPVTQQFRVLVASENGNVLGIDRLASLTISAQHASWGLGWSNGLEMLEHKALGRQAGLTQMLSLAMHLTPSPFPYTGVGQFLSIPFYVVPRAIWPSKPELGRTGATFTATYLGQTDDTTTSNSPTLYGDLYMAGGWITVFAGMAVLGLVMALLYRKFVVASLNTGDVLYLALYGALMITAADVEARFTILVVDMVQHFAVYLVVFLVCTSRKRDSSVATAKYTVAHAGLRNASSQAVS
jgi:hypothetical protein